MECGLVIGTKHLNSDGLLDARSIHETLVTYQSAFLRERLGSTFEQLKAEFGAKLQLMHTEIMLIPPTARLNEHYKVITNLSFTMSVRTMFTQEVKRGDRTLLTSMHSYAWTGSEGELRTEIHHELLRRLKISQTQAV